MAAELHRAGVTALLAEPAESAEPARPKRRAKTGKADARHLRALVAEGQVPLSVDSPEQVSELRRCCRPARLQGAGQGTVRGRAAGRGDHLGVLTGSKIGCRVLCRPACCSYASTPAAIG